MLRKLFFVTILIPFFVVDILSAQQMDINNLNIIEVQEPAGHVCKLPPTNVNANFFVRTSPELLERIKKKASSSFEVDYFSSCGDEEWPQEAVTAFEFALAIWAEHINSNVPIKVNANWQVLSGTTLGSARPTRIVQVSGTGVNDTWYTLAQLSALSGRAIREQLTDENGNPIEYDIDMNVQCNFDDWYFGTDANVPNNKSDFVTVILHEIGHGIGFLGSMDADTDTQIAEWGIGEDTDPLIYDRFAVDGDSDKLINTSVYPNPSSNLYSALIGNRDGVYFDGVAAKNSLIGQEADRAKLYTPDPFNEGSSYSHLDQATFRQSINALMLPFIDRSFAVHTPGPLFCGMLSDMGWPLGEGCLDLLQSPILATDSDKVNFGVLNIGEISEMTLLLTNRNDAELPLTGSLSVENGQFTLLGDVDFFLEPGESREITISYSPDASERNMGTLSISHNALNATNPLNIPLVGEALDTDQVVQLDQSYPNPFVLNSSQGLDMPVIEYAISKSSTVKLDLFSITGRLLQSLVDENQVAKRYRVPVDMNGYASGIYIYRIVVDGIARSGKLMYVR